MRRLMVLMLIALAASITAPATAQANWATDTAKGVYRFGKQWFRLHPFEKELLLAGKEAVVAGKKVVQRNDLFDINATDAVGRTNLERMRKGLAPIAKDGKPMELHHLQQENDGVLMELSQELHRGKCSSCLHPKTVSEIDRADFAAFRSQYWMERAKEFVQ